MRITPAVASASSGPVHCRNCNCRRVSTQGSLGAGVRHAGFAALLGLALLLSSSSAEGPEIDPADGLPAGPAPVRFDWEDRYAYWRERESISIDHWLKNIPPPVPAMGLEEWEKMDNEAQNELFDRCLTKQAQDLSHHVLRYQSPDVLKVRARTLDELAARGAHVVVSIFWGRERYVRILWPYLERNLRANKGIVDKIILITKPRDSEEGNAGARAILEAAIKQYPGIVEEVPFCPKAYGCAFDEIMTDPNAVYLKMDDDIVFIKDGSIEHLVSGFSPWLLQQAGMTFHVFVGPLLRGPGLRQDEPEIDRLPVLFAAPHVPAGFANIDQQGLHAVFRLCCEQPPWIWRSPLCRCLSTRNVPLPRHSRLPAPPVCQQVSNCGLVLRQERV